MTEDQHPTDLDDRTAEAAAESAPAESTEGPEAAEFSQDAAEVATADAVKSADHDQVEDEQVELPLEAEVVIDDDTMRQALEAILMVTDEPLPVLTLARAVGRPTGDVSAALATLADEYTEQGRGFDLREVGGGWRYYTRPESAQYVERFVLDGQQARLTQAALETLAVVAYKQPVSRARVSAIRGVNVDGVMRTLVSRGLVEEAGSDTESQATLYRTTSYFLERMGMQSLDDLPELAPYLPEMDDVEEELAAQNGPTQPADETATADETAITDETATAGADATSDAEEAVTSDVGAATDAEGELGIDADMSTGDGPELDLEHGDEELAPAEELEAGGDTELEQVEIDPDEIPETGETPAEAAPDRTGDEDDEEDDLDGDGAGDPDDGSGEDDFGAGMGEGAEAVDDVLRDDDAFSDETDLASGEDDVLRDEDDVLRDDVPGDQDGVPGDDELAPAEELEAGETQYRVDRDD